MASSIASKGARGGAVIVIAQLFKLLVQVASVVVLSRLLDPGDFGLIAMTAVVVSLATLVRDFGIPIVALQARSLTGQQASNLFWLNSGLGVTASGLLVLLAPLISAFYAEPRLTQIIPFMALSVVAGGVSAQHQVHLARDLKFGALALSEVVSQMVGLCAGICGALLGFGYWALAWQAVATSAALLSAQVLASRWRPMRPRADGQTRPLVVSGLYFGSSQALNFASSNIDTLLIGARWGADELGYYNRAFQLLSMPVRALMGPLTNVVLPIINKARGDGFAAGTVLLRIQFLLGSTTVWIFLAAGSSAIFSVPLLLGPGWGGSIQLFQILAFGGAVQAFTFISFWEFLANGDNRSLFRYDLTTKSLSIFAVACACLFGISAVAWAYSIALMVSWPISLFWLARVSAESHWPHLRGGLKILVPALVAALVTSWAAKAFFAALGLFEGTLLCVGLSTVLYLVGIVVIPGGLLELQDSKKILLQLLPRRR